MIDQQYFVPGISDLRIGDYIEIVNSKGKWITGEFPNVVRQVSSLDQYADDIMAFAHTLYRLPYLTQEQLESEGWVYSHTIGRSVRFLYRGYKLQFSVENNDYKVFITNNYNRYIVFNGQCRDINTLRYIQKLLNIK